eukprot:TRINITY_DN40382_c0_g1_i1.p1 TRINITY_DN40382_c0_g1~~TRINITY_DN40382_c0_g1_i1.p1  ORF type:complete len:277 (+),score=56.55 TRINITY_DN40382_c0_g1_i1:138-968(+)
MMLDDGGSPRKAGDGTPEWPGVSPSVGEIQQGLLQLQQQRGRPKSKGRITFACEFNDGSGTTASAQVCSADEPATPRTRRVEQGLLSCSTLGFPSQGQLPKIPSSQSFRSDHLDEEEEESDSCATDAERDELFRLLDADHGDLERLYNDPYVDWASDKAEGSSHADPDDLLDVVDLDCRLKTRQFNPPLELALKMHADTVPVPGGAHAVCDDFRSSGAVFLERQFNDPFPITDLGSACAKQDDCFDIADMSSGFPERQYNEPFWVPDLDSRTMARS